MPPSNLNPLSAMTLNDHVYTSLRDYILMGTLEPGSFLREQELSERLGVSRTPVREALVRLAQEGLVERLPRRGFRMVDESVHELLNIYPIVAALEELAGKDAIPRLEAIDVERLENTNLRLSKAVEKGDARGAVKLNNRFHELLCEKSGNERLLEILSDLRKQATRLEIWFYSDKTRGAASVRQHKKLIQALRKREWSKAMEMLANDYKGGLDAVEAETATLD